MVIFVDMDMTLNKLWIPFCEELNKKYNRVKILNSEELIHYQITKNFSFIKEEDWFDVTNEIFKTPGIWRRMPIQENAREVMEMITKKHDVYIVTSPWINYNKCWEEKIDWIKTNLPYFDISKVIFCIDKHLLKGDYIIDDAPRYLEMDNGIKTIAMDYPYNRKINVDIRIKNWNLLKEFISL